MIFFLVRFFNICLWMAKVKPATSEGTRDVYTPISDFTFTVHRVRGMFHHLSFS